MWGRVRGLVAAGAIAALAFGGWLALKLQGVSDAADLQQRAKKESEEAPLQQLSKAETELLALYDRMGGELAEQGLNASAIAAMHPWFHGVNTSAENQTVGQQGALVPWPKKYAEFAHPLPPYAVRLLVIPLDCSPSLAAAGAALTAAVLGVLPSGTQVFSNARVDYHCTLFHTSHPNDPRPNAAAHSGDVDLALSPAARRGPTFDELDAELANMREVVSAATPPTLELHRVLLASSGTLLMTWVDRSGRVDHLRGQLREAFPGASTKQACIIHTSLARIVSTDALPASAVAAVQAVCDKWTLKLRGRKFVPLTTWFVRELEFSTIVGQRDILPFRGNVPGTGCGKAASG